ncbi:hypothetical protein [Amniculibacterium sp. G2-70]|uniref:hypothetical protein n=1 Tax=Amniculibacterium sp. G2-70 TaxID=2767188 RepID=UPI001654510D|nr:hypothetical protein [Amniculibacterium sp. G2-70]
MNIQRLNYLNWIMLVMLCLVFGGKLSTWFIDYSDETKNSIASAMFVVIGICYLSNTTKYSKNWMKILGFLSGIFVIVFKFLDQNTMVFILAFTSLITPFVLNKIDKNTWSFFQNN